MSGSIETNPAIARPNAAHTSIFDAFTRTSVGWWSVRSSDARRGI